MKKGKFTNGTLWLVIIAAGVFAIASCNKNSTPVITHGLIKSIAITQPNINSSGTLTYTISAGYDNQNRITSIINDPTSGQGTSSTTTFTYSGNTVMATLAIAGINPQSTEVYLNSQGYADSAIQLYACRLVDKYTYNTMGFLDTLLQKDTCGDELQTVNVYNSNSDLDTQKMISGAYTTSSTTFTYLSGHTWPSLVTNVCDPYDLTPVFIGKQSGNLWSQQVQAIGTNVQPTIITATYEFDSQDRVHMITESGGVTLVYTYW